MSISKIIFGVFTIVLTFFAILLPMAQSRSVSPASAPAPTSSQSVSPAPAPAPTSSRSVSPTPAPAPTSNGRIPEYTYEQETGKGPEEWSKLNPTWEVCNTGKLQSPIDLSDGTVSHIHDQALIQHYQPALASVQSRGHDIMVSWKGDAGKITINQTDYKLSQCHWHSPSEHTINGTRYDIELHMVHTSVEGKIAVVGVLYKLGEPDQFLTKLLDGIKSLGQKEVDLGMVDPLEIKVETKNFYRYIGSLTTPPCTEGVIWTVAKKVNTISNEQMTALKEAVDDGFEINSRPIQDPHGRPVWFQV